VKYADAWEELKKKIKQREENDWTDGVNPYGLVLDDMEELEQKHE
jgi:hypothetical protein